MKNLIKIPHPHFQCPKVKKEHFRKTLFLFVAAVAVAHFFYPEIEGLVGVACNFMFFYEPTVSV